MESPMPSPSIPHPPRVQTLSESLHLPPCYIQPESLRPKTALHLSPSESSISIPTVDLSIADPIPHVRRACLDWGAFHISNHGVPSKLLEEIRRMGRQFFEAQMGEKLRFCCDPKGGPTAQGYGSKMLTRGDTVLDWRDYFNHHTLPEARRDFSKWPDFIPNYRELVLQYSTEMKILAQRLLTIISQSLQLPPSYIQNSIGEEIYQNITISYYPPCPEPDLALGLQSHSDMGAITLLIQDDDVAGLEVLKDDKWVPVQPLKDSIVVILSDMTEIITNGEYKSAVHRAVVNGDRARLSVATFYDPSKTCKIFPAPNLVNERNPAKYKEVVYGDFVKSWYGQGPEGKRTIDALMI